MREFVDPIVNDQQRENPQSCVVDKNTTTTSISTTVGNTKDDDEWVLLDDDGDTDVQSDGQVESQNDDNDTNDRRRERAGSLRTRLKLSLLNTRSFLRRGSFAKWKKKMCYKIEIWTLKLKLKLKLN